VTVREMILEVLPKLLPSDPSSAKNGTELLPLIQEDLRSRHAHHGDDYIRQVLSSLAVDSASPVARREGRHGYYMRSEWDVDETGEEETREGTDDTDETQATARLASQPEEKFRALLMRHARIEGAHPMRIEHRTASRRLAGVDGWKFPDVVLVEWDQAVLGEEGVLDTAALEVKRSLGEQPFTFTSVELKVSLSLGDFRQAFFQCLSNSRWAHRTRLAVATAVDDNLLATELRRLGGSYGVEIVSHGLPEDQIQELPSADEANGLSDDRVEQLIGDRYRNLLSPGETRANLDWDHIRDMRRNSPDFKNLFEWIAACLDRGKVYTYPKFTEIQRIDGDPSS